jgi:acetyl esterase/lipase
MKSGRLSVSVLMIAVGAVALLGWMTTAVGQRDNAAERPDMTVLRDIEYVPGGHERQKLDLYLPKAARANEDATKRPLIVWVHGGAWLGGSKDRCRAVLFVRQGYAVASINYRLSQDAIFPAQIQDCKAAIRWLRAHADKYGWDPERIGVWGSSAGGHLVALLGTAGDVNDFDVGPHRDVSSRVQAVCDVCGPTDLTQIGRSRSTMDHDAPNSPVAKLLGGPVQKNHDKAQRANPITYVTEDDPPFLIVHGDKDPLVPHSQSEILYDALKKADVEATLYIVRGGGHGGFKDPNVPRLFAQFFRKHLHN